MISGLLQWVGAGFILLSVIGLYLTIWLFVYKLMNRYIDDMEVPEAAVFAMVLTLWTGIGLVVIGLVI